jgi:methionyl-tRNA formyltransferase
MKTKDSISKSDVNIVFFGTPHFAAEILRYLFDRKVKVLGIVTQPDRPKGRSLFLSPSPVKSALLELFPTIPLLQPEKASQENFLEELRALKADLFVVVAYGQILTQKLLDIPPLGCINVHASLLPKFRGAAPIQRAILEGEKETGVAIQKMVRQLDAGDVIAVAKTLISEEMTSGELQEKLCELSKPLLLSVIHSYKNGIPPAEPQDPSLVTHAAKIEPEEVEIDWTKPAERLHNLVRGFSPRPGAWCWIQSGPERKRLKILKTKLSSLKGAPGALLSTQGIVACGKGTIEFIEVQPEGKRPMKAIDWLRGQKNSFRFEVRSSN